MRVIDWIIVALVVGVAVTLVLGIINLVRGADARRSNRLMVWRVVLQGAALILAGIFLAAK